MLIVTHPVTSLSILPMYMQSGSQHEQESNDHMSLNPVDIIRETLESFPNAGTYTINVETSIHTASEQ